VPVFFLDAAAADSPDATAIYADGEATTYAELAARVEDAARRWLAAGHAPGSPIAVQAAPGIDTITQILGAVRAGYPVLPLNPRFPESYVGEILASLSPAPVLLAPGDAAAPAAQSPPPLDTDAPALLVLTSGSSGPPKAAALSLGNLLASAEAANANIPLSGQDAWLLSLPLFHVAGLGILFRCVLARAAVVIPAGGEALLDQLSHPRVTHASLVATQLHRLVQQPGAGDILRRLSAILLGGSAIPPALLERAAREGLRVHTSYGMTETAAQIACTRPGEGLEAWRSSGYPLREGTLRISPGGEIEVSGPAIFLGYWPARREGDWFPTGDLGSLDEQGRLHVSGRVGQRFVCGGENVQPEEVERALLTLPGILRARVVAAPDPEYVHVPVAFLEQDPTHSFDGAALLDALRPILPKHALPRYIFPWPAHLEREGEKIARTALESLALSSIRRQ
jgi:O-succinylbenzoic acid--CoA ligase